METNIVLVCDEIKMCGNKCDCCIATTVHDVQAVRRSYFLYSLKKITLMKLKN